MAHVRLYNPPPRPRRELPPEIASAWRWVRGLERMSLSDWPGRTCPVLFLGGCNLYCPTCHNADLAWRPQQLPQVPRERVFDLATGRKAWYDGLVVTGGEPTAIRDLPTLLRDLQTLGLPIKVDTNGMRPHVVEALLESGLAHAFFVDVKGPFHKYPELTGGGVTASQAEANLRHMFALAEARPDAFVFRTTKVPALTPADLETVRRLPPAGFTLKEQAYKIPGRSHAQADNETRRVSGDVVY